MAKVLIVDDSRTSRRILRNILTENGHEVVGEAENGQIGYEKYIELSPDIITLDITMPVLDGLGSLKKIMAYDEKAHVIMITAAGQKNKMVDAIKLGANEFIQKPFEPEQILSVIQRRLSLRTPTDIAVNKPNITGLATAIGQYVFNITSVKRINT